MVDMDISRYEGGLAAHVGGLFSWLYIIVVAKRPTD